MAKRDIYALVRELAEIQGSQAVLRIMQAHGFTHAVEFSGQGSNIGWSDTLEDIIDRIAKEKGQKF